MQSELKRLERPRLVDVCADTFLFLTAFRREAGRSEMTVADVAERLEQLFRGQEQVAIQSPELYALYEKAKYPLVVTCDAVIRQSEWRHARDWPLLESEWFQTAIGGEKFFQLRDDPANSNSELQEVFFVCLAIGFEGMHQDDREEILDIQRRIYGKLEEVPRDRSERVCASAYGQTMGEDFTAMPVVKAMRLAIVLLGVVLMLTLGSFVAYNQSVQQLNEVAREIPEDDGQG